MASFVEKLFTKKSFETSHLLVDNVDDVKDKRILMPDGTRYVKLWLCIAVYFCYTFEADLEQLAADRESWSLDGFTAASERLSCLQTFRCSSNSTQTCFFSV